MTPEERSKLRALSLCVMLPSIYEKRFVRSLVFTPSEYELSEKQKQLLDNLYWRYRRQIYALISNGHNFAPPVAPPVEPPFETVQVNGDVTITVRKGLAASKQEQALAKLRQWNKKVNP